MSKNQRFFVGTLCVRIGEYDNNVRYVLVANTEDRAWHVLDRAAANYYGDGNAPKEDGGYYANNGEVHVSAVILREVGLAEFQALKGIMPVRYDDNVREQEDKFAGTPDGFKSLAKSAANLLEKRGMAVSHSVMLEVLAGALGAKNWQVLSSKLANPAIAFGDFADKLVAGASNKRRVVAMFDVEPGEPGSWTIEDIALHLETCTKAGAFKDATVWEGLVDFLADMREGSVPTPEVTSKPAKPENRVPQVAGSIMQAHRDVLEEIGFEFTEDPSEPGRWTWQSVTDICEDAFRRVEDAVGSAWADAASQAKEAHGMSEARWNGLGFKRQCELLRELGGQDSSGEGTYIVEVCRIGYGVREITVQACSESEAEGKALDEAGNYLYDEHTSEYQSNGARRV